MTLRSKSDLICSVANAVAEKEDRLVSIHRLEKMYHTPAGDFPALCGIDLEIGSGEFAAIVGKSGSGKSTLINIITGIDRPTAGEVVVNNTCVSSLSEEQIAIWRGTTIGIIFQFFQLLPSLTAVENIMLAMDYGRLYPMNERPERAMGLLNRVGMVDLAHRLPAELSGGQQQCVAIARALANDPPLLAADEPTGNLDSAAADRVFRLFEQLVAEDKTILMVTHDRELASRSLRTVVLADGRIADQRFNC